MRPESTTPAAAASHQASNQPREGTLRLAELLVTAAKLGRTSGPGWLLYRLWYAVKRKTGIVRQQLPARSWAAQPLSVWTKSEVPAEPSAYVAWRKTQPQAFFFKSLDGRFAASVDRTATLLAEAEGIIRGSWRYFHHLTLEVGFPPQWHVNPLTGHSAPADKHWSQIGDFDYGDIKLIWEASRFSIAYALVGAYAASHDQRYAAAFWTLLEDWALHNAPQLGPNWKCGQEASFRVMAWCFALFAFADSPHTTPERVALLAAMLAVHAQRIEGNISYALSQRNNHALSEAVGLWTVGLLFPEFQRAGRWRKLGRRILETEAPRQIGEDGSYIQHSFNYHRVMLHDYIWALRLGELNGQRFSNDVYDRVDRAVQFLYQHTDPATGRVPNYGSNDGTLVLPLNNCDYTDARPVLQASHYLLHRTHLYPRGPWDEDLVWLFGPEATQRRAGAGLQSGTGAEVSGTGGRQAQSASRTLQASSSACTTGYSVLHGQTSRAMIRCARYRDRPGHADQLHLDLWWRGINIACDAGSYLYNGEPPWVNGFAGTAVHNTVNLDHQDQMTRVGHFLWVDWAQGTVRGQKRSDQSLLEFWEGEHDGYRKREVTHRRAVLRAEDDVWLVVDDIVGCGEHVARLHWLLPDFPYDLQESAGRLLMRTPAGAFTVELRYGQPGTLSLVRGGEVLWPRSGSQNAKDGDNALRGWRSRYYADKEPALSLALQARATLPLRFTTVLAAAPAFVEYGEVAQVNVATDKKRLEVELSLPGTSPIIQEANLTRADCTERLVPVGQPGAGSRQQGIHLLLIHQMFAPPTQAGGTRHYELASRLVRQGFQVTIDTSDLDYITGSRTVKTPALMTEESMEGVRVLRCYTYPSMHRSYVWRVVSFLTFGVTSMWAGFRAGQADVVMGTTPPLSQAVSAWLVAFVRRRPFLLEVRDLWPEFAIDIGVLTSPLLIAVARWLERFLYARAVHLIVNSPAYRDYLIGKGVPAARITLIPNGVNPEMFEPGAGGEFVRARFGLENRFVVTYAGALGLANDLETVLRAAERLRDDPAIHFLLVGDGKERPRLEAQARALHLPNVTFAGAQPKSQMPAFLAASDACVATLKDIRMFRTTYPNKVFDYMAAGRPTILAIDGVIRQVIEASGGGVFVSPGDDAALAEAVQTLSRDRPRAQTMGSAARAYVTKHFHRQRQAEQLAALLRKVTQITYSR